MKLLFSLIICILLSGFKIHNHGISISPDSIAVGEHKQIIKQNIGAPVITNHDMNRWYYINETVGVNLFANRRTHSAQIVCVYFDENDCVSKVTHNTTDTVESKPICSYTTSEKHRQSTVLSDQIKSLTPNVL
ncbi:MAG: hypothetical protein P857_385 [Candidatus Xenolissoclinum pacificiensis L6]|uniref:SmpA / OmlA family protein n=1 Tax=Candidatus Xenolissoclinum pacificiensis L6 TaxID=1401685 RepID=W2V029_9RICK|nr:MAG: hypothetical protein P857_385 [Candidatus Xenolissoclinum pacificiensis L6]